MNQTQSFHLVLAGPRAVGKTTIGKAISAAWSRPFVDLDDRVLQTFENQTVSDVWDVHGELAWREAEKRVLASVLSEPPSVIALGGGVPTIQEAADCLNETRSSGSAIVIWLKADPAVLESRLIRASGDRPSLTGQSPAEEIAEVSASREEAYRAISDHQLDVGEMDLETILGRISRMAHEDNSGSKDQA
ncbi:MAG: shikimate kinase [Phycisphaerales bacterium]|nr:shikimate kinase [Phycisphaerales bacterium]